MTKAMRWGASALLILGSVGLASFVGCSSDDEPAPQNNNDTGGEDETSIDTGTPDTNTGDTATDSGTGDSSSETGETGPKPGDRNVTLFFGSPDLGGMYACFGAFTGDPAAADKPLQALGPIGIPPSATSEPKDYAAIPYGAVIPLPIDSTASTALKSLTTVIYLTATNPAAATPAKTCADVWKDVKGDTKMWQKFAAGAVGAGEHALVSVVGCKGTSTSGECGAGNNLEFKVDKLDTTKPTAFAGATTGPKVGIQFLNYSRFPGVTGAVPPFQHVDAYLLFRAAASGGDAGADGGDDGSTGDAGSPTPVAAPLKIASDVSYGDKAMTSVGVQAGPNPEETVLLLTPKDVAPCTPGTVTDAGPCTTVAIPLKTFLTSLAKAGGGFVDGQNQFMVLAGGPVPPPPGATPLRVGMGRAYKP
jgi:hypothetical protein